MAVKYCHSCGNQIEGEPAYCPNCGAKQVTDWDTTNTESFQQPNAREEMSMNKILSLIALGLSIVSIVAGGLLAEIAAVVIATIVLKSNERCEPEARTFAKIALVIGAIFIAIRVIIIVAFGGMVFSTYDALLNL